MKQHRAATQPVSEAAIQRSVIEHLKQRAMPGVVWFHPANGEHRNKVTGARLKKLGVRPGVADLIFLHQGTAYALELKRADGSTTDEQRYFLDDWVDSGGRAAVCGGVDAALARLEAWGLLRPGAPPASSRVSCHAATCWQGGL